MKMTTSRQKVVAFKGVPDWYDDIHFNVTVSLGAAIAAHDVANDIDECIQGDIIVTSDGREFRRSHNYIIARTIHGCVRLFMILSKRCQEVI